MTQTFVLGASVGEKDFAERSMKQTRGEILANASLTARAGAPVTFQHVLACLSKSPASLQPAPHLLRPPILQSTVHGGHSAYFGNEAIPWGPGNPQGPLAQLTLGRWQE